MAGKNSGEGAAQKQGSALKLGEYEGTYLLESKPMKHKQKERQHKSLKKTLKLSVNFIQCFYMIYPLHVH